MLSFLYLQHLQESTAIEHPKVKAPNTYKQAAAHVIPWYPCVSVICAVYALYCTAVQGTSLYDTAKS